MYSLDLYALQVFIVKSLWEIKKKDRCKFTDCFSVLILYIQLDKSMYSLDLYALYMFNVKIFVRDKQTMRDVNPKFALAFEYYIFNRREQCIPWIYMLYESLMSSFFGR